MNRAELSAIIDEGLGRLVINDRHLLPDLIIHQRGPRGPNLLAMELKKTTNQTSRACDVPAQKATIYAHAAIPGSSFSEFWRQVSAPMASRWPQWKSSVVPQSRCHIGGTADQTRFLSEPGSGRQDFGPRSHVSVLGTVVAYGDTSRQVRRSRRPCRSAQSGHRFMAACVNAGGGRDNALQAGLSRNASPAGGVLLCGAWCYSALITHETRSPGCVRHYASRISPWKKCVSTFSPAPSCW